MSIELTGRARKLGDDINTDYIIASRRKRDTLDENVLRQYLLEAVDPAFAASVSDGDILVAGRNFGCGSAMEIAATVILGAGIKAVVAQSFSRTFYRNAINNGLLPIACDTTAFNEGDTLAIRLAGDIATVTDVSNGAVAAGERLPPIMIAILASGGLVGYMREHGSFQSAQGV